jgi:hypothetical protein
MITIAISFVILYLVIVVMYSNTVNLRTLRNNSYASTFINLETEKFLERMEV